MQSKNMKLYNKNGIICQQLAEFFIMTPVGTRIPTFTDFVNKYQVSRGTVQKSMELLVDESAVTLAPRGHKGTFLVERDIHKLIEIANIENLYGVMAIPHSKHVQGFATGIMSAQENDLGIRMNLSYAQCPSSRLELLISKHYDFAITSEYFAQDAIKKGHKIEIISIFDQVSAYDDFRIGFNSNEVQGIRPGMRIGYDINCHETYDFVHHLCEGTDSILVGLNAYDLLHNQSLDAWVTHRVNQDIEERLNIRYFKDEEKVNPVLIIEQNRPEVDYIVRSLINDSNVRGIQKQVVDNKLSPHY